MSILRNPILWAGIAFTLIVVAMSTFYTVHETQQVVVLRLGKPARIVNAFDPKAGFGMSGAGLSVKAPFIENTIFVDKRVLNLDMEQQTVLTTDQLRLVVDAFARFRITNPVRMYTAIRTEERLTEQLKTILGSSLRNELGKRTFATLLSAERGAVMDNIQTALNREAMKYGAQVIDVRIKRADLPSGAPLESAFLRMRSARQQEAATIRAQGLKQAQLVRADADAQAASIYAGSFGKDPQFYAFYRAMQAYRTTFTDSTSTIVMSPNNEFLREFEGRQSNR